MHFKHNFDPEKYSLSEGWKKRGLTVNPTKIGEEMAELYLKNNGIPTVTRNYVKSLVNDIATFKPSDKKYTEWDFDINSKKIGKTERENFLEMLGIFFDRRSVPHSDGRPSIPLGIEDTHEFEYILENVDRRDYALRKEHSGRHEVTIANPAYAYYFYNRLSPLSSSSRKAVMRGIITDNLVRLSNDSEHKKIVFRSSNEITFDRIDLYTDLERLQMMPLHYSEIVGNGDMSFVIASGPDKLVTYNSIWYLKPSELQKYIIEGFDCATEKLNLLPDFSEQPEQVLLELATFKRIKTSNMARFSGELTRKEHDEMKQEFEYRKGLLEEFRAVEKAITNKIENIEYFNERDELSKKHDVVMKQVDKLEPIVKELHDSLYGPKPERKKKSSGSRRRGKEVWKNQKAQDNYGK